MKISDSEDEGFDFSDATMNKIMKKLEARLGSRLIE